MITRRHSARPQALLPLLVQLCIIAFQIFTPQAHAHVGSKDVYQTVTAGPYTLYVTVRPPNVIPGVAAVEVRSSGAPIDAISITPLPVTGEASRHPPAADAMQRSASDPAFYTGAVWIMSPGTWQVRLQLQGSSGTLQATVPVVAVPVATLHMQRGLGTILALLGLFLVVAAAGIVAASVRESRLPPGASISPRQQRRGIIATAAALAAMLVIVWLAGRWWNVEAADYANHIYTPLPLQATLSGNQLRLVPGTARPDQRKSIAKPAKGYLLDHGKVMHLYAIRFPAMDAAFHLHPALQPDGTFTSSLPTMPPGHYRLFADVVHANGFPETLLSTVDIPSGLAGVPLDPEDASARPAPLESGMLPATDRLPDGYTLAWDRPESLVAGTPYVFRFRLLDPAGKPATNMQPYLGMAGHAAFVKTDASVFAHTHPEGSAPMPDVMLAQASLPGATSMDSMAGMSHTGEIAPEVGFPYGFPTPGRYRIFIQMKHDNTVETGVFDAEVR